MDAKSNNYCFIISPIKFLLSLFLVLIIISCNFSKSDKKNINKGKTSVGKETDDLKDSVLIPKFEIEIKLSDNAEKKIMDNHETIVVRALFIGIPKDTTLKDIEYKEIGQLTIASKTIELKKGRIAKFNNIKIALSTLKSLKDENFEVNINVFTGRKSSEYNLIDSEFLQDYINNIKNKKFILKGKLINE